MSLKNKLKLGIASLATLLVLNTAKPQSIEGNINSSGSYPRPALENVLVSAEALGQDYTDINGHYRIPPLFVPPNVQLNPLHGQQIGYGIFDVLGRKVGNLNENETLEQFLSKNRLASNFYVLKSYDNLGEYIQKLVIVNSNVVGQGGKEYKTRFNNIKVLDNLDNLKGNNRNLNTLYEFYVDDDGIIGEIGEFYGFVDTLDVSGAVTKDVRLIPHIETNSPYYDNLLELMIDLEKPIGEPDSLAIISNYGGYPNTVTGYDFPQRIWLNPEQAYQYCQEPELYLHTIPIVVDSINTKLERKGLDVDLFTIVDDSIDANIWMNYTYNNMSYFDRSWEQIGDEWYIIGGVCYIMNCYTNPFSIYAVGCHELGIRGLGMEGMSQDPNHIAHVPVQTWDFAPIEIDAMANHVLQYNNTYMANFIEE